MAAQRSLFTSLLAAVAAAPDKGTEVCAGFDTEVAVCPPVAACTGCTPIDCQFSDWGPWYSAGGCTGLLMRSRTMRVPNNECGKPCNGSSTDSMVSIPSTCLSPSRDCRFADWSDWTMCTSLVDQRSRSRIVLDEPLYDGNPCVGSTVETSPCDPTALEVLPCEFSPWTEWQPCSVSCGGSVHTRTRRISRKSSNGGAPCVGTLSESVPCGTSECVSSRCIVSPWSSWSNCTVDVDSQTYRRRSIVASASGNGEKCNDTLSETKGCVSQEPTDCVVGEWGLWSTCDASCNGGQQFRSRFMIKPSLNGGLCPATFLSETMECNSFECTLMGANDAVVSVWSTWSACLSNCGPGFKMRERNLTSLATPGGVGFVGPMKEIAGCQASVECGIKSCAWSNWTDWSECSHTCGGGQQRRSRFIAITPEKGGRPCDPLSKEELAACNTQGCSDIPVDGLWSAWMEWSPCSATCEGGYRSRSRVVSQAPNAIGKPATGPQQDLELCTGLPSCIDDMDCMLSDWSQWGSCSSNCVGVRSRGRQVNKYASGKGKPCLDVLAEIEPCQGDASASECSARDPVDCVLADWSVWTPCTRDCGGGQTQRSRSIVSWPENGGGACSGDLHMLAPCREEACSAAKCDDCRWSQWEAWSKCNQCGSPGESYRSRHIEQLPNECGKPCGFTVSMEVVNCTVPCKGAGLCRWTDWSNMDSCANSCGSDTSTRVRSLTFTQRAGVDPGSVLGTSPDQCTGLQKDVEPCEKQKCSLCEPRDCQFAPWNEWSSLSCSGLCERSREIAVQMNECGKPCSGPLTSTKRCESLCADAQNCIISSWSPWSMCATSAGQRSRSRMVQQEPRRGGTTCKGALMETRGCSALTQRVNCALSEWAEWSACSRTCGEGLRRRSRRVMEGATGGGIPCLGSLKEAGVCSTQSCAPRTDCRFSQWASWTDCGMAKQQRRSRDVLEFAEAGGAACRGSMDEIKPCDDDPVDCVVAEWSAWSKCDKTCGGGQQTRQRLIREHPKRGGQVCPSNLAETSGCSIQTCGDPCELSPWTTWTDCSVTCGIGYMERSRDVTRLSSPGGRGCRTMLSEVSPCQLGGCQKTDCLWGQWTSWSSCTLHCGGGERSRFRDIQNAPSVGGKACEPLDKITVEPCNTQPCVKDTVCVNGTWGTWSDWSPCSRTCEGGVSARLREALVIANSCGVPVTGDVRQTKFCAVDEPCQTPVDCQFSDWDSWSDCTSTCMGVKMRLRRVSRMGAGSGKYCIGALSEYSPCNPDAGVSTLPVGCGNPAPVDCALGQWDSWSACSATCGGAHRLRSRNILHPSANGGQDCSNTSLREAEECPRVSCEGDGRTVDCQLSDWQDWSVCADCGGQRTRERTVVAYPQNGGMKCAQANTQEVSSCPLDCYQPIYCVWADWGAWSTCSAKCGDSKKERKRYLLQSNVPAIGFSEHLSQVQSRRASVSELTAAFAAGCVAFVAAAAGLRLLSGWRRGSSRQANYVRVGLANQQIEGGVAVTIEE
eukprot:TRINITY_DN22641_c0_g1_i1.p1 TRINITY_DN22641_c0_g1~~TRINITY_DN22641_c0_g1_i1.p1  ORF type:complete len:1546 (-),score=165.39 TRINITY_DN22641_c0_g1_i1:161-4675(-)